MDLEKRYYDFDNNECNIMQMVRREPGWAANRIQIGEGAIRLLRRVLAWRAGDGDGITDPVRKEIIEYLRGAE